MQFAHHFPSIAMYKHTWGQRSSTKDIVLHSYITERERERERERQRDRETERQRETERDRDRETGRQVDR